MVNSFSNFVSSLQKSISENKHIGIVPYSVVNQKMLYLLQVNGYIEGFKILNIKQIKVFFKFKNNLNVIKRIYKFRISYKYKFKASLIYKGVGLSYFTILSTRRGLVTNKDILVYSISAIPLIGVV